jgi:hypothetical protein
MTTHLSSGMRFALAMLNNLCGECRKHRVHIQEISRYAENYVMENNLPWRGHSRRTVERNMNRLALAGEVETDKRGWYWCPKLEVV